MISCYRYPIHTKRLHNYWKEIIYEYRHHQFDSNNDILMSNPLPPPTLVHHRNPTEMEQSLKNCMRNLTLTTNCISITGHGIHHKEVSADGDVTSCCVTDDGVNKLQGLRKKIYGSTFLRAAHENPHWTTPIYLWTMWYWVQNEGKYITLIPCDHMIAISICATYLMSDLSRKLINRECIWNGKSFCFNKQKNHFQIN